MCSSDLVGADPGLPIRQRCDKNFYVSPFLAVAGGYDFEIIPPAARVSIGVGHFDCDGPILEALLVGARKPLSDAALIAAFVRYPLVTLKVMAGIHWEAFKLWRKGIALHRRPAPPEHAVTIVPPSESPEPTAHVATRI